MCIALVVLICFFLRQILFPVLFSIILVDLSVFTSLSILKFKYKKNKASILGEGEWYCGFHWWFRGFLDCFKPSTPPCLCFKKLLETSHSSLLDTLQMFICDICLEFFVCIYVRTWQLKVQQRGNVLKACPLGFALKMAVLSKVK